VNVGAVKNTGPGLSRTAVKGLLNSIPYQAAIHNTVIIKILSKQLLYIVELNLLTYPINSERFGAPLCMPDGVTSWHSTPAIYSQSVRVKSVARVTRTLYDAQPGSDHPKVV
jgi:hypothetical protein